MFNEFYWTQAHEKAFNQLKEVIPNDVTLQFFNQDLPLYIEVDASKKGIAAVMTKTLRHLRHSLLVRVTTQILRENSQVLFSVPCTLSTLCMVTK